MNPAVVVNAYNRPASLARLLSSIRSASYPAVHSIPLVISLDDSANHPDVAEVAERFEWPCGPKEVIRRPRQLGLKGHFYACGDLSEKYGSIIYLEDDLMVSPVYYQYASQALAFYQTDARIGGISLYSLWFNGYTHDPFIPYQDGAEVFFLQLPYTQGLAFTTAEWSGFRLWQKDQKGCVDPTRLLHESWSHFKTDEWFPEWTAYLAAVDRYFVYPRVSLSTGMGDPGAHFSRASLQFQTPLLHEKQIFQFRSFDDSYAVYDSYFEMMPTRLNRLTGRFLEYDYCVDLNATRSRAAIPSAYVLTTRRGKRPLFTFAKTLLPPEANVIEGIAGEGIVFCRKGDLRWDWRAELLTRQDNQEYFSHGRSPSLKAWVRSKVARLLKDVR